MNVACEETKQKQKHETKQNQENMCIIYRKMPAIHIIIFQSLFTPKLNHNEGKLINANPFIHSAICWKTLIYNE